MKLVKYFLPLLLLSWTNFRCDSVRILCISFFASPSHKIVYDPLLEKLAERGHEITVVSPLKVKDTKNIRNIQTIDMEEWQKKIGAPNMFEMKESKIMGIMSKVISPIFFFGSLLDPMCRESYKIPFVQDIISGREKFDLILYPSFFNDCLHGLIHHLNLTTIYISQVSTLPWLAASVGSPSPPSFVPLPLLGYADQMTFFERLFNFIGLTFNELVKSLLYNPQMERVYRDAINPNLPGIKEIEANASLIIANSHVSFTPPKPLMPDIIDVGGMHLKPAKAVKPQELEDFLSGSGEDGFILFSMGSALKAHTMPEKYRKIFLNTFAKLKQRVIWKWETESMDDLPPNVKLSKWLPQQDVLGHKNIKLFITHGGHGGTTEAIYHGVPLVGIPMMGDQPYNMKVAVKKGFAYHVEFADLTAQLLTDAIQTVLNVPTYRETAKKLSAIYRDQMNDPLDRAVYWVEYAIRHGGARHLRSAARDLSTIQYFSLDVMATLLLFTILILYIDFLVVRALYRKCCGRARSKVQKSDKKRQ